MAHFEEPNLEQAADVAVSDGFSTEVCEISPSAQRHQPPLSFKEMHFPCRMLERTPTLLAFKALNARSPFGNRRPLGAGGNARAR